MNVSQTQNYLFDVVHTYKADHFDKKKIGRSSVSMNLLNSLLVDLAYVYIFTCNSADRATSQEKECTWKKQSRPITSLLGCCP